MSSPKTLYTYLLTCHSSTSRHRYIFAGILTSCWGFTTWTLACWLGSSTPCGSPWFLRASSARGWLPSETFPTLRRRAGFPQCSPTPTTGLFTCPTWSGSTFSFFSFPSCTLWWTGSISYDARSSKFGSIPTTRPAKRIDEKCISNTVNLQGCWMEMKVYFSFILDLLKPYERHLFRLFCHIRYRYHWLSFCL